MRIARQSRAHRDHAQTVLSLIGAMVARSLLFGLRPSVPKTVFMAIAMLAVVAMAASYFPARWGARLIRLPRYVMNELRKIPGDPQRKVARH